MSLNKLRELTESLENAELEILAFFDLCPNLLAIVNLSGYFTKVNSYWTTTLGWSHAELTSKPWLHFVHPDDVVNTIRIFKTMVGGKKMLNFVNRYKHRNGDYIRVSWDASELHSTKNEIDIHIAR